MTGLRERKRAKRRTEIMLAAARVFKEHGYEAASVEQIAARADVSPGTVYNHFPSKDTLLIQLAALYRSEASRSRTHLIENPKNDPTRACADLYSDMVDQALTYFDRKVWRHVLAAGMLGSWDVVRKHWLENEQSMIDDEKKMLGVLKSRRLLDSKLDERAWARIIHAVGLFSWQTFVADDDMTVQDLKKEMRALLRSIFLALGATQ